MKPKTFRLLVGALLATILISSVAVAALGYLALDKSLRESSTVLPPASSTQPTTVPPATRASSTPAPSATNPIATPAATASQDAASQASPALPAAHPIYPAGQACETCHQNIHKTRP